MYPIIYLLKGDYLGVIYIGFGGRCRVSACPKLSGSEPAWGLEEGNRGLAGKISTGFRV